MSHPYPDTRFTDSVVRANPVLRDAATQWALGYTGEFEFMVNARQAALAASSAGQMLPVAVARGVLNCMRADPGMQWYLQGLPQPVEVPPLRLVRTPPPRPRPYRIRLKVMWKKQYLLSTWPTARLAHVLNPERSEILYWTSTGAFQPKIYALCNKAFWEGKLLIMTDDPQGREVCKRCQEKIV